MKKLTQNLKVSKKKAKTKLKKVDGLYISEDHSIFRFLDFNRKTTSKGIAMIADSMIKHGYLVPAQVFKFPNNPFLWVGDGQHRVIAAKRCGLPVKFMINEINSIEEAVSLAAILNSSSTSWSSKVFLSVWSNLNIREYVKFKDIQEKYGYSITTLLHAYTGKESNIAFKKGELKFNNEKKGDIVIEQLENMKAYLPKKAFCQRKLVPYMLSDDWKYGKMKKLINAFSKEVGFSENQHEFTKQLDYLMKCANNE